MNGFDKWVLARQIQGQHVNGDSLEVSEPYRDLVQTLDATAAKKRADVLKGFLLAKGINPVQALETLASITLETPRPDPESEAQVSVGFDFAVMSVAELDAAEIRHEWLVENVLVADQPCVVGGPRKALKTSVMIAMGLALATGGDFLGRFRVPSPRRVLFLSGESGESTVQETLRRVARSDGINLAEVGNDFQIGFRLPALGHVEQLAALARQIEQSQADVVIIDPLYLCLLGSGTEANASNLYEMGPLLAQVTRICLGAGATPILVHHLRKNRDNDQAPPELEDLAFAGVQEFARQWLLLGRRKPYEPGTGHHELWINYGGSAGQSGAWALTVEEGVVDENFEGRFWSVEMVPASEAREDAKERNREEAEQAKTEAKLKAIKDNAVKVAEQLRKTGPATKTMLRDRYFPALSGSQVGQAIEHAFEQGWVALSEVQVPNRGGFRLAQGFAYVDQSEPKSGQPGITRNNPESNPEFPVTEPNVLTRNNPEHTPPLIGGCSRVSGLKGSGGENPPSDLQPGKKRKGIIARTGGGKPKPRTGGRK